MRKRFLLLPAISVPGNPAIPELRLLFHDLSKEKKSLTYLNNLIKLVRSTIDFSLPKQNTEFQLRERPLDKPSCDVVQLNVPTPIQLAHELVLPSLNELAADTLKQINQTFKARKTGKMERLVIPENPECKRDLNQAYLTLRCGYWNSKFNCGFLLQSTRPRLFSRWFVVQRSEGTVNLKGQMKNIFDMTNKTYI